MYELKKNKKTETNCNFEKNMLTFETKANSNLQNSCEPTK